MSVCNSSLGNYGIDRVFRLSHPLNSKACGGGFAITGTAIGTLTVFPLAEAYMFLNEGDEKSIRSLPSM